MPRIQSQQLGSLPVGVWGRLATRYLVTAHADREIVPSDAVERPLGQHPPGIGHQRHRDAGPGEVVKQFASAVAPRQPGIEQLAGDVMQPVRSGRHLDRIGLKTQVGVDEPDDTLR